MGVFAYLLHVQPSEIKTFNSSEFKFWINRVDFINKELGK